jgi:hypothetical protein
MNPIFRLVLKQLPVLLPVAKSLLKNMKNASPTTPDDSRLNAVEQSLQLLAERFDYLETKLKRMWVLVIVTGLLSVVTLIVVLVRS